MNMFMIIKNKNNIYNYESLILEHLKMLGDLSNGKNRRHN